MDKLKSIDSKPSNVRLNVGGVSEYKTKTGGFLNLIYILIGLSIFFAKIMSIVQGNNVQFTQQIIKQNDIQLLNITSANFQIQIRSYPTAQKLQNYYDRNLAVGQVLKFSQYAQYGVRVKLNVHTVSINEKNRSVTGIQEYDLQECKDDVWSGCVMANMSYFVRGRIDFNDHRNMVSQELFRETAVLILKCNKSKDQNCKEMTTDIKYFITFTNNQITPNSTSHSSTITPQQSTRSFQSHNFLSPKLTLWQQIYIKKATILTDNSFLPRFLSSPSYQQSSSWFYDQQKDQQLFQYKQPIDELLVFSLKRSAYTHVVRRWYDRVDDVLARVFGIMGLLGLAVFGLWQGYNGWGLQQYMRQKLAINYYRRGIMVYFRYRLIRVLGGLCSQRIKKQIRQDQRDKQMLNKKLDIINYTQICKKCKNQQQYQPQYTTNKLTTQNSQLTSLTQPLNSSISLPQNSSSMPIPTLLKNDALNQTLTNKSIQQHNIVIEHNQQFLEDNNVKSKIYNI